MKIYTAFVYKRDEESALLLAVPVGRVVEKTYDNGEKHEVSSNFFETKEEAIGAAKKTIDDIEDSSGSFIEEINIVEHFEKEAKNG